MINFKDFIKKKNFLDCEPLLPPDAIEHFEKRTKEHIARVQENAKKLVTYVDLSPDFLDRVAQHDRSKFYSDIYQGYVWIDYHYNCNADYPSKEIRDLATSCYKKHYQEERHHPEHYSNCNDMTIEDLAEMICDWHAMSQELGGKTSDFWKNKASRKYNFDECRKNTIEKLIQFFEQGE